LLRLCLSPTITSHQ